MTCTSPCTISGPYPGTEYQFTVIPKTTTVEVLLDVLGDTATVKTACECGHFVCVQESQTCNLQASISENYVNN